MYEGKYVTTYVCMYTKYKYKSHITYICKDWGVEMDNNFDSYSHLCNKRYENSHYAHSFGPTIMGVLFCKIIVNVVKTILNSNGLHQTALRLFSDYVYCRDESILHLLNGVILKPCGLLKGAPKGYGITGLSVQKCVLIF